MSGTVGAAPVPRPWSEAGRGLRLAVDLARREVEKRYRGSYLGLAWLVLGPFLLLAVYTFVYAVVLRVKAGGSAVVDFVVWLYAGLGLYLFVAEVASGASASIRSNPSYVKKVVVPLEAVVSSRVLAAASNLAVAFVLLLCFVLMRQGTVHATVLLTPLVIAPLVALCYGGALILASVGVFVRDVDEVVRPAVRVLFYLTPIAYPEALVPAPLRAVLRLNPLATAVENYRRVTVFGLQPDWWSVGSLAVLAVLAIWLGRLCLERLRPGFADVV